MNKKQRNEVIKSLYDFVLRVSKGGVMSTKEEIAILPAVTSILVGCRDTNSKLKD
jgi:hypothetical protein